MSEDKSIEIRIEENLDKIRPFLQRDGGDIRLERFDEETGVCYVDMIGACAGCFMAATDISDSIEIMLMDEIPEIKKVELIAPSPQQSFDDLIRRLQAEQKAQLELDEINKNREENQGGKH